VGEERGRRMYGEQDKFRIASAGHFDSGDGRYRRTVPLRDGPQGISQRQITAQPGLLKIGRAAPPIIFGKLCNAFLGEAVR